jgi:RNA polymerase sigma-70 factor (ECF subfamily)
MADIHDQIASHIPNLRRYARALVRDAAGADDLVQECLARAVAKLHLWQQGTDLRAWLFVILHNQNINRIRRSIRAGITIEFNEVTSPSIHRADQESGLELRDLDRALGLLPADQRAAILMVGLEGMSYDEAAAALQVPVGTVRSRLSRGREALRHSMGLEPRKSKRQETRPRTLRREVSYPEARMERSVLVAAAN